MKEQNLDPPFCIFGIVIKLTNFQKNMHRSKKAYGKSVEYNSILMQNHQTYQPNFQIALLDYAAKLTKTYGVIFGAKVLQNAPSRFPCLIEESTCFSMNTFFAKVDSFGLNFSNDSKTSFTDLSYG